MRKLRGSSLVLAAITAALVASGCSYIPMPAAEPPRARNLALFQPGSRREALIAEFGRPVHMEIRDGTRYDLFRFVPGRERPPPPPNASMIDSAIVALPIDTRTPEEIIADLNAPEIMVEVTYTREDYVMTVTPLRGAGLLPIAGGAPSPGMDPASSPPYSPRVPVAPVITSSIR